MEELIVRLKQGPKSQRDPVLAQLVERIKRRNPNPVLPDPPIEPRLIERLALETRRLRRLNEAQKPYLLPILRINEEPEYAAIIEKLELRLAPFDETELLQAQTFALPSRGVYEALAVESDSDTDYEAMRLEAHAQNEWCEKLIGNLNYSSCVFTNTCTVYLFSFFIS